MLRLGGTASASHIAAFRGIETLFRRRGIDIDWVLYSSYDAMVEAFASGEIDLAWNGPLSHVKMKRLVNDQCQVLAMRDVDVDFITHFITYPDSDIATVEDLKGKRFAFGSRGSVQSGLLAYHFLKQVGINPRRDLDLCTFFDQREERAASDERDVVQRVASKEYDAGAVSRRGLEVLQEQGALTPNSIRVFWSSPGYSHCCFTGRTDMEPALAREVTEAFLSVDPGDPVGKSVLDAEGCKLFLPGISEGWETLEAVAVEEGLVL